MSAIRSGNTTRVRGCYLIENLLSSGGSGAGKTLAKRTINMTQLRSHRTRVRRDKIRSIEALLANRDPSDRSPYVSNKLIFILLHELARIAQFHRSARRRECLI